MFQCCHQQPAHAISCCLVKFAKMFADAPLIELGLQLEIHAPAHTSEAKEAV